MLFFVCLDFMFIICHTFTLLELYNANNLYGNAAVANTIRRFE